MGGNQISLFIIIGIVLYLALKISTIYHNSKRSKTFPQKLIWYAVINFAPFIGDIVVGQKRIFIRQLNFTNDLRRNLLGCLK